MTGEQVDESTTDRQTDAESQLAWSALCCCSATECASSAEAAEGLKQSPGHYLDEVVKASSKRLFKAVLLSEFAPPSIVV